MWLRDKEMKDENARIQQQKRKEEELFRIKQLDKQLQERKEQKRLEAIAMEEEKQKLVCERDWAVTSTFICLSDGFFFLLLLLLQREAIEHSKLAEQQFQLSESERRFKLRAELDKANQEKKKKLEVRGSGCLNFITHNNNKNRKRKLHSDRKRSNC
jgi:hypothetical protein